MRPELYYAIINIVDFLALAEVDKDDASELYRILDKLLRIDAEHNNQTIEENFEGIADANDAGGVKTWQEMVEVFKELHKNGERI